ncbi:MAG: TetR/AcrR family transcriptional regulator [Myxococcota bacterium]|jgi:AcrR family transcriptional regulator|nr:TetR/AcrR family transcriptional regulator [Myxococcota bacterium]
MNQSPGYGAHDLGRRERRKLEVRARILEAGLELFEARGVEATKVQAICERADIAQKTFFNYFPTKRHLLREIAQVSLGQLLRDIEAVRKLPVPTREKIHAFFAGVVENADEAGPMRRELLTEMVHIAHEPGEEHREAQQLRDAFAGIVADGLEADELTDRYPAEALTEMLMGAFYVQMFNWANLDAYPLREHASQAARFLTDSMEK